MPIRTPTDAFIDALRYGSYLCTARCTVYSGGVATQWVVPISTMNIVVTRTAAQRRSGTITAELVPGDPITPLLPITPKSPLAPFGNEIYVETGIAHSQSTTTISWFPSGLFSIATTQVANTTVDLVVTLTLYDRSWVISERKLRAPYNFPATPGGYFETELRALLDFVWGSPLTYNIAPTDAQVPVATLNEGTDPWQAALAIATAVGYELFFSATGTVVAKPTPTAQKISPSWTFSGVQGIEGLPGTGSTSLLGNPYSTPTGITNTMTREGIANDIIVSGTGTTNAPTTTTPGREPVRAEERTTNQHSPTYATGPMGDIPTFVSSNLVTTTGGAQAMASNRLKIATSSAWRMSITAPPNPIFDIDDVVVITAPQMGISTRKIIIDRLQHVVKYATLMVITGRVIPPA